MANIYHYIFVAHFGNPRFDLLLKITLLLSPLEGGKVTMMVIEEETAEGKEIFQQVWGRDIWVLHYGI